MAKVLFVMKYPLEDAYSVKNKFNGQMDAVNSMGHEAYFVGYDRQYTYLIHKGEKTVIKNIMFGNWKQYIHTKAFFDLFDSVCRVLKDHKFDMVYLRYCPLNPFAIKMLKMLNESGTKVIVEIPTYPIGGGDKKPPFLRRIYFRYSADLWSKAHKYVDLYTLIGEKADEIDGKPAINIDNGTNVDLLPLRQHKPDPDKIHLLALAAMSDWQAYDRIIEGIARLSNAQKSKVVLHMVGGEGNGALAQWTALAKELGLDEQVVFHGVKTGPELDAFFNLCDLGIGTLGLYRKGFQVSSILKLREYCSRGLPFIYAGNDSSLPTAQPFCVHVSNDDTLIDVPAVLAFAEEMRKYPDMPQRMRDYARAHMSWEKEFQKVFDALTKLENSQEA